MMILNESGRDELLLPFLEILKSKGIDCKLGDLKRYLLKHFVEDGNFRNLSLGSNFYLAGVARYYFNGDLTQNKDLAVFDETNQTKDIWNEDICKRLNALILILRNSVVDSVGETFEQPEDFGDLPIAKLLRKYGAKINKELGVELPKKEKVDTLDRSENVGNGYTFDILYSQNDATKYYAPTQPGAWCITYALNHYNYYKNHLGIHYVIFKKDGWENVPRQKGPDWTPRKPQDEYGCSLIALLQSNKNGEPVYITSRWNHGYEDGTHCEADHAFTKEEFFAKTGVNDADLQRIFAIWKKDISGHTSRTGQNPEDRAKKLYNLRDLKYRQMRINGGENPDSVMVTIPREMTDKEQMQVYIKSHKFTIIGNGKPNKSIIDYTIEIEGVSYHVLVDKGRILFESLVPSTEYKREDNWIATYEYTDRMSSDNTRRVSNCYWLHNMIVIRLKGDKYKLYDIRRHQFLDVGGVTTFKYLDNTRDWQSEGAVFYELKLTNRQMALVDINTNTPLKLPNGQYWFEELRYDGSHNYFGREVKPEFVKGDVTYLTIIYDSSAREVFFYNMLAKRFENLDISHFNNINNISVHSLGLNDPTIMMVFNDGYLDSLRQGFIFKDGKKMAIGNIEYFNKIGISKSGYIFLTLNKENLPPDSDTSVSGVEMHGEKDICWVENEQSFITLNGEPFRFANVEYARNIYSAKIAKLFFFRRDYDLNGNYNDDNRYIYSIFSKQHNAFLINPDTKDITFKLGARGCQSKKEEFIELYNGNNLVKTYQVNDLIDQGYLKPAIVPHSAPLHFVDKDNKDQEQMGEPMAVTVNERVEYNMDDIKEMVLEVLNNIKKKK